MWHAGLLDHVTMLIGIAVKGKAVAGIIYQPYHNYQAGSDAVLGRIIWGIVGLGNFYTVISLGFNFVVMPHDRYSTLSYLQNE